MLFINNKFVKPDKSGVLELNLTKNAFKLNVNDLKIFYLGPPIFFHLEIDEKGKGKCS